MGLRDRIQGAAAGLAEHQAAGAAAELAAALPPGTEIPRRDLVRRSDRFPATTIEAYVATLALRPEDVYTVLAQQSNDIDIAYVFLYRERPEYATGRARWAESGG